MASIPLPALQTRPIQSGPSPLETYAQAMGIKNQQQEMQQRQALAPIQQQSAQLQLSQAQQQQQDQKAITAAMQQWDGKDYNKMIPLVLKNGGSAQAVMGLKQKVLEQQQSISTTLKNNADAGLAQVNAQKTKNDEIAGAISPLIDPQQVSDDKLRRLSYRQLRTLYRKACLTRNTRSRLLRLPKAAILTPFVRNLTFCGRVSWRNRRSAMRQ